MSPPRVAFDYKPVPRSARAPARWFVSRLLLPLIGGVLAYLLATGEPAEVTTPQPLPPSLPAPAVQLAPAAPPIPEPLGHTVEFVVRRNDTLDRIFRQLKLSLSDLASIRDLPGVRQQLDQLRPGDTITLIHEEGLLHALSRRISETEVLSVRRLTQPGGKQFAAEVLATPLEIRTSRAQNN